MKRNQRGVFPHSSLSRLHHHHLSSPAVAALYYVMYCQIHTIHTCILAFTHHHRKSWWLCSAPLPWVCMRNQPERATTTGVNACPQSSSSRTSALLSARQCRRVNSISIIPTSASDGQLPYHAMCSPSSGMRACSPRCISARCHLISTVQSTSLQSPE